jgi:hypothetical protein
MPQCVKARLERFVGLLQSLDLLATSCTNRRAKEQTRSVV